MTRVLFAYAGALLTVCVLDFVWLGVVAKGFYQAQVGPLLLAKPQWAAAGLLYAIYAAGIVFFAILPEPGSLSASLWRGALLGLVVYGVYNLTNLATLAGWTTGVAALDTLWGIVVTAVASAGGAALARLAGAPG